MPTIPKKYRYEIWRQGIFKGILEPVTSPFQITQNINTAGVQLMITVGKSADVAPLAPGPILDETGDPILDETGEAILEEHQEDVVGDTNDAILVRNGNDILVYEISDYHVNGKLVFSGYISKWRTNFGSAGDISVTCLSQGQDLGNYLIPGSIVDTVDQQQTTFQAPPDNAPAMYTGTGQPQWPGQIFKVGAGIENLSAIDVKLGSFIDHNIKLELYNNANEAIPGSGVTPIASATVFVPGAGNYDALATYQFRFATPVTITPLQSYFFVLKTVEIVTDIANCAWPGTANAETYANGKAQIVKGGILPVRDWTTDPGGVPDDLYFKTYYTDDSTARTYTNADPSADMLDDIMDAYVASGGHIDKQAAGYGASGVLIPTYTFKLNTVLEGIQKVASLGPSNWYWFADIATGELIYKAAATTPDHTLIKGVHITDIDIEATKEENANVGYFSGGPTTDGSPINVFTKIIDNASLQTDRVGLIRLSDNRVQGADGPSTGQLILQNYFDQHNGESYTTTVTVMATTYDLTLFKPGHMVAFDGFGNFADTIMLQIASINLSADVAVLTLGRSPRRSTKQVEDIQRQLTDIQTLGNPASPS